MKKQKSGISLIVLVITIIVIIILAVAVILSIANNNPIENANKAKFQNDLKTIQEELTLKQSSNYIDEHTGKKVTGITIESLSSAANYTGKLTIQNQKLYIKKELQGTKEEEWANEVGITVAPIEYVKLDLTNAASEENKIHGLYIDGTILKGKYDGSENNIELELPEGITRFDSGVFSYCGTLKSIKLPNSIESLGVNVFEYCKELESIVIPTKITKLPAYTFTNCSLLKSVILPEGLLSIESGAFESCSSLTNIAIPDTVTEIGSSAFMGCIKLENVEIPNGVTTIEDATFNTCQALKNIVIPNNVKSIGAVAFGGCTSLTNITLEKGSPLDPADAANWGVDTTKCTVTKLN